MIKHIFAMLVIFVLVGCTSPTTPSTAAPATTTRGPVANASPIPVPAIYASGPVANSARAGSPNLPRVKTPTLTPKVAAALPTHAAITPTSLAGIKGVKFQDAAGLLALIKGMEWEMQQFVESSQGDPQTLGNQLKNLISRLGEGSPENAAQVRMILQDADDYAQNAEEQVYLRMLGTGNFGEDAVSDMHWTYWRAQVIALTNYFYLLRYQLMEIAKSVGNKPAGGIGSLPEAGVFIFSINPQYLCTMPEMRSSNICYWLSDPSVFPVVE